MKKKSAIDELDFDLDDVLGSYLDEDGPGKNEPPAPREPKAPADLKPYKITAADMGLGLGTGSSTPVGTGKSLVRKSPTIEDIEDLDGSSSESMPVPIKDPKAGDRLIKVVRNEGSAGEIELEALNVIAEEIAYLRAVREHNYNLGLDVSKISLRRVQSAKSLLETIAKKKAALEKVGDKAQVDFSSDSFRKVFKYILEAINKSFAQVGVPEKFKQSFFKVLAKNLENFERDANNIVNGKPPVIASKGKARAKDADEDGVSEDDD